MGIAIIIFSLLPALIYSLIIYLTVPYKTIKFNNALPYIVVGFMSVGLLKTFWVIYPEWHQVAENLVGQSKDNPFKFFHAFYFIQVALIEELSKLGIFLLYERYRRKSQEVKDHPIATMFHMGLISLGFAVVENVMYGSNSPFPMDTLWWRSITAVIGHMVFGLFMGYWIALGRMGARLYDRSLVDILISKKKKLRNVLFTIVGLLAATILHGIYDLHIEMNGPTGITGLYMLLIMSLLGAYWCFKNLNKLYKRKVNSLKNKIPRKS
jgi:RsiW-degrading membrane proteinase PrsW (M82 family)